MDKRQIEEKVYWLGAVDWDRRLPRRAWGSCRTV